MNALNMVHYKVKLRDVSQQLYREHGWNTRWLSVFMDDGPQALILW